MALTNHSIISRRVSNVIYNVSESRVYNVSPVVKLKEERRNNTNEEQMASLSVEYATLKSMKWSDSASTPSNIVVSMYASIPFVGGDGSTVELTEERNLTVVFGKEQSESQTTANQMNVAIPPRKKLTLTVTATRAHCNVPFSYRVIDTLSNGSVAEYIKNDGLYTGSNEFGLTINITEDDI